MSQSLQALPAVLPRAPGDTSPALVCSPIFEEICINANGDIVCSSCDINGQRVYGNVFKDRIGDVYNGPTYKEMRDWLLISRPDTWCPAIKHQCPRRTTLAYSRIETSNCRVKVLKLEPITYCNLECPACPVELQFKQNPFLRETRGRKLLPLATMLDIVSQLPDLEWILYFNFGEPFLHKDTIPFLREVRRTRPSVRIATNTNGLVLTPAQIKAIAEESLMDRVIFSIDGADPASYRKYRVGGDLYKALNKMKALVDECRAAGTWRQYGIRPPGGVNIAWQYILFEWNDSEEEMAKAQEIAKSIGVPIEWVITCGYGASKRFLAGTPEAARLMNGAESFIHTAAPADLANRIEIKNLSAYDFDVYKKVNVTCDLLSLPYKQEPTSLSRFLTPWSRKFIELKEQYQSPGYQARLCSAETSIDAPTGSTLLFQIDVQNRTYKGWDLNRLDFLRLGIQLQECGIEEVIELPGVILPVTIACPLGKDTVALRATVPDKPGSYKLRIDVVQESVCWFSKRGGSPLEFNLQVK